MSKYLLSIHKLHDNAHVGWLQKHMRRFDAPEDKIIESACTGQSYWGAIQTRINNSPYYDSHKVRSNAVLAYSVYISYSEEASVDQRLWGAANLVWLQDIFDCAPDGVSNILEVVYHTIPAPHFHALVIPIDPRGHLCARSFTNGRIALAKLQESYTRCMQSLGLTKNSNAAARST